MESLHLQGQRLCSYIGNSSILSIHPGCISTLLDSSVISLLPYVRYPNLYFLCASVFNMNTISNPQQLPRTTATYHYIPSLISTSIQLPHPPYPTILVSHHPPFLLLFTFQSHLSPRYFTQTTQDSHSPSNRNIPRLQ